MESSEDKQEINDKAEESIPPHDDTQTSLDTAMKWPGNQEECDCAQILNLKRLWDLAAKNELHHLNKKR